MGGFHRASGTLAVAGKGLDETIAALASAVSRTNTILHTVAKADAANLDQAANAIATSDTQLSNLRNTVEKSSATLNRSLADISRLGTQNSRVQQITESLQQITTLLDNIAAQHHTTDHAIAKAEDSLSSNATDSHGATGSVAVWKGSPGYPINVAHDISWSDLFHVVHGDPDNPSKGGHLFGLGRPGKTEFPEGWDEEDIREALIAVAGKPDCVKWNDDTQNWKAEGFHRQCKLCVFVRHDGSIEAGHPLEGPGVRKNRPRRPYE